MKRILIIVLAVIGVIILTILVIRIFTPEDTCIKDANGQWTPHGHPATPCPENSFHQTPGV